jgi:hypothetical protein
MPREGEVLEVIRWRCERELPGQVGRRTSDPDRTGKRHRPNRPGIEENLSGIRIALDNGTAWLEHVVRR